MNRTHCLVVITTGEYLRCVLISERSKTQKAQTVGFYLHDIREQDRTGPGAGRGVWWTPKRPKKSFDGNGLYLDCGGSGHGGDMIMSIYQNS